MHMRDMMGGRGKLGELINDRSPHIRPTTFRA
jgi:hypothetical protein